MIWNIDTSKIGVIGYGSWATAIVNLLANKGYRVNWWIRSEQDCEYIRKNRANPRYLVATPLNMNNIDPNSDLERTIRENDCLIFITPSAYLSTTLEGISPSFFKDKYIISSIKGLDPASKLLISEYFNKQLNIPSENYCVLAGPSHAEEVSRMKTTFLTAASTNDSLSSGVALMVRTNFIHTITSDDVIGIEIAGVLKNIYTIGIGIAMGLDYMDNFISAFIGGCFREMEMYIHKTSPNHVREISHSVYLGDLLTTGYSPFSRNRKLGFLIGKGNTPQNAIDQMEMVAEGYNSAKFMVENHSLHYTIAKSIYDILYNGSDPEIKFKEIEQILI